MTSRRAKGGSQRPDLWERVSQGLDVDDPLRKFDVLFRKHLLVIQHRPRSRLIAKLLEAGRLRVEYDLKART